MVEEGAGNINAAQDLYGAGVRIGLYLQAFGLTLNAFHEEKGYGKASKLASGSICAAILSSWFVFAAKQSFSPCEAYIILLMLVLFFPINTTIFTFDVVGDGLGLLAILLTDLGLSVAFLWAFSKLVVTLPQLGTENVVFFFTRVKLDGWFRWFALAYFIIDALTTVLVCWKLAQLIKISWDCRRKRIKNADHELENKIDDIIRQNRPTTRTARVMRGTTWIWVIITVEVTIQWNHLEPTYDLQAPGQLIPLMVGIFIFVDSLLAADFKHILHMLSKIC